MFQSLLILAGWGMIIYPDDRVLVAIMNNQKDWQRVLDEGWYRINEFSKSFWWPIEQPA